MVRSIAGAYFPKLRWWCGAVMVSAILIEPTVAHGAESERVHPQVWADTAGDRSACFLVVLKEQADPAAAGRNPDRKALGRAILGS